MIALLFVCGNSIDWEHHLMKKHPSSKELLERAYSLSNEGETRALYRDWARTYDQTMLGGLSYLTPKKTADLLLQHQPDKAARILDVGCGTGLAGEALARHGFKTIEALDYSPEMLQVARDRTVNSRTVYKTILEADLNQPLALENNTYDAMIATGLFTHAHVGAGCLDELFRVLKPGGKFAVTVQKDVWQAAGFAEKTALMEADSLMRTLYSKPGKYFETDQEPAGFYIVWEALA